MFSWKPFPEDDQIVLQHSAVAVSGKAHLIKVPPGPYNRMDNPKAAGLWALIQSRTPDGSSHQLLMGDIHHRQWTIDQPRCVTIRSWKPAPVVLAPTQPDRNRLVTWH
jgi:hypothetical protein